MTDKKERKTEMQEELLSCRECRWEGYENELVTADQASNPEFNENYMADDENDIADKCPTCGNNTFDYL